MKRLLDLNRLADVAIAERDTDGTDGYATTVDWTNEVRPSRGASWSEVQVHTTARDRPTTNGSTSPRWLLNGRPHE
jgi:hypothetical protein